MSGAVVKEFCETCGYWVNPNGHEQRCGTSQRSGDVLRASAWLGDAEVAVDVRVLVLASGGDQKTWQAVFQGFTDRVYQSKFHREYGKRKVTSFGVSEHSVAQAFEATYYYDDAFRYEFLGQVCRELAVDASVNVGVRPRGVVACGLLKKRYWTNLSPSSDSALVRSSLGGSSVATDGLQVVGSLAELEIAESRSSRCVGESVSGSQGVSVVLGPVGLRAEAIATLRQLKEAAQHVDCRRACVSSLLRLMTEGEWETSGWVLRRMNTSQSSSRCRGCKERFLTRGQFWSHLLGVVRDLVSVEYAHVPSCHSELRTHRYLRYTCDDHEGEDCIDGCSLERGHWKLLTCRVVADGDVQKKYKVRPATSLCLSLECCVCETGGSDFREYGQFGCDMCEACLALQDRDNR